MDVVGSYKIRVRGAFACYTRPELKTERVSYEVITPSAARGVLEAVFWKPAIFWHIRRIFLLSSPRFIQFKRNEVNSRVSTRNALQAERNGGALDFYAGDDRARRNTVALRDVDYAIEAEMLMTSRCGPQDNARKFDDMFRRRLERGQFYTPPYLGCREFPAIVEPYDDYPLPVTSENRDLGLMLHDIRYGIGQNYAVYFRAHIKNGVIEIPRWVALA
jgi:CRISPR-associated protein Cas5d